MFDGEPARLDSMLKGNAKVGKSVRDNEFVEFPDDALGAGQLADSVLGRDLPGACGADENGIIFIRYRFSRTS